MNTEAAKNFIINHARPLEMVLYRYFYEHGTPQDVITEFAKYQNADGGF